MTDDHVIAIIAAILYAGEGIEHEIITAANERHFGFYSKEECIESAREFLSLIRESPEKT